MNIRKVCLIFSLTIIFTFTGSNFFSDISNETPNILISQNAIGLITKGNGSFSNPYQISNIFQLENIRSNLSANYIIINDIDGSVTKEWNNGLGFYPLGNHSKEFNGTLEGSGYTVNNLYISSSNDLVGLFSIISNNSIIKNLHLEKIEISGQWNVGGIAGNNHGLIDNCTVSGKISGKYNVGGISGVLKSVHENSNGRIINSQAYVNIYGIDYVGGVVGRALGGVIDRCSSGGNIYGFTNYDGCIGGLLGGGGCNIYECFSNCTIYGEDNVGGLIGLFSGNIYNSYSIGNVFSNGSNTGGLIGFVQRGRLYYCYSIGNVSGVTRYGGLVGDEYQSEATNCYWDKERSSVLNSPLGIGKSTNNMMKSSSYSAWDFDSLWNIIEDKSYPFLRYSNLTYVKIINILKSFVNEDEYFSLQLKANSSLPGGKGAFWDFKTNAGSWLNITESGVLSGIPTNDNVGEYWVNVSATINHRDFDYLNFTLEVVNTNDPPIIETMNIPDAKEDSFYSFTFEGSDIDPFNDTLTWSMETDGEFLEIDPDSGTISGIPSNNDTGSCSIKIILDDGNGGSVEKEFKINVYNINDAPMILPFEVSEVLEDESFSLDLDAIDEDPTRDNMLWSMRTDAEFIEIGPISGIISGIPGNKDVGTWWIVVNVTDKKGGYDEVNFNIEVLNVNDDPFIDSYEVRDAVEDVPYFLDLDADDIDSEDVLEWTLDTDASFLSIDGYTGNITGTPENDDVGIWSLNVSVFDGNGGIDYKEFDLKVLNVNDPPQTNLSQLEIEMEEDFAGFEKDLNNVLYDIDGDPLSFDHSTSDNLSISIDKGNLKIIPKNNWSGLEIVRISASDGSLSITINASILVTPVNDPPFDVAILARSTYYEGEDQIVDSTAIDADIPYGDELTYTWFSNTTGEIGEGKSINLSLATGYHLITLTVTDREGLSASSSMEIEVLPDDDKRIENGDDKNENGIFITLLIISIIIIALIIAGGILFFLHNRRRKLKEKKEAEISRYHRAPPLTGQYVKGESPFMIQRTQKLPETEENRGQLERLSPIEN